MKPPKQFVGKWRITETEVWNREALAWIAFPSARQARPRPRAQASPRGGSGREVTRRKAWVPRRRRARMAMP